MFPQLRKLILAAALIAGIYPAPVAAEAGPTVVELFTSQGCSRCPPADAYLAELAARPDIIALSFHVDYWNYIGWRDPFSRAEFSARQRDYERHLNRRYVYTPQLVVDGRGETVGSKRQRVEKLIAAARRTAKLDIQVTHDRADSARIRIPAAAHRGRPAIVWVALYDSRHTTEIKSGENRGRKLVNTNVVRRLERVGTWNGRAAEFTVDLARMGAKDRDGCAILVQRAGPGPILGAATIPLPR